MEVCVARLRPREHTAMVYEILAGESRNFIGALEITGRAQITKVVAGRAPK